MEEEISIVDVSQSEDVKELVAALCKAQAAITPVVKGGTNPHFKSKYAELHEVIEASAEPFRENGIAVVQIPVSSGSRVGVHTKLLHTSGQWIAGTLLLKPSKDDPQGAGSAITYARRYALLAFGNIPTVDDDGNAASGPKKAPYKAEDGPTTKAAPTRKTGKTTKGELMELANKTFDGPAGAKKWLNEQGFESIGKVADDALPGLMAELQAASDKLSQTA